MHFQSPRSRWLLVALFLTALLGIFHLYAIANFWYWKYRWFDTPMHLLGGAAIGAIALGLFGGKFRPLTYLAFAAFAFVSWEIFEAYEGIAVLPGVDYVWDTAHDLLNDVIGATAIYTIARYTIWR